MTTEDQIAGLLAKAEPLRSLPDEEAEAKGLPAIVDAINALRKRQEVGDDSPPITEEAIDSGAYLDPFVGSHTVKTEVGEQYFYNPLSAPGCIEAKAETDRQAAAFEAEREEAKQTRKPGRPKKAE